VWRICAHCPIVAWVDISPCCRTRNSTGLRLHRHVADSSRKNKAFAAFSCSTGPEARVRWSPVKAPTFIANSSDSMDVEIAGGDGPHYLDGNEKLGLCGLHFVGIVWISSFCVLPLMSLRFRWVVWWVCLFCDIVVVLLLLWMFVELIMSFGRSPIRWCFFGVWGCCGFCFVGCVGGCVWGWVVWCHLLVGWRVWVGLFWSSINIIGPGHPPPPDLIECRDENCCYGWRA